MNNELNDTKRKEDSVQVSCKQMVEVTTSGTTDKESDTTVSIDLASISNVHLELFQNRFL